jgi:uncharacterized membrane protein
LKSYQKQWEWGDILRRSFYIPLLILVFFLIIPQASLGVTAGAADDAADGGERIISFHSNITVLRDASMIVEENIKVHCANIEINHGIYRDFPTRYQDLIGNQVSVDFRVRRVLKNGVNEPYSIENRSNGKRIKIGSPKIELKPGDYEYTIVYETDRQLGFFQDHDELYWNVTGNGWIFPIGQVKAIIRLPGDIPADKMVLEGYTGPYGSEEKDFTTSKVDGLATFRSTRVLGFKEGLTIVVSWPKGYVTPPDRIQLLGYLLKDNLTLLVALLGIMILMIYYLYYWGKVGKDPKPGTVIPLYYPPENLSPAAIRFIKQMGSDNKGFTAAVIDMAVKGAVLIRKENKDYTLERKESARDTLTPEETQIFNHLLKHKDRITLDNDNHSEFQSAITHFGNSLTDGFQKENFSKNLGYFGLGILISVIALTPGVIQMFKYETANWILIGLATVYVVINIIFIILLKAYTLKGRKLMDQIEGFKMYLSVAEKERLNLLNPPNETPELFEKYLPYALALDVEQHWAQKFAGVLARAGEGGEPYTPLWYVGAFQHGFIPGDFAHSLGSSFSSAISSAATPPGSSSGSSSGGGGGFSGGGGGGGGGGGW